MASIENVRHFVAVVENSGVVRASEKLFLSASSVTRSIKSIEQDLGRNLFDRVGRTLRLNQEGQDFYKRSKRVLEQFSSLLNQNENQSGLNGHYRIGGSHFLCESLLGGLLNRVSEEHRSAAFEVFSFDTSVLLKKIQLGNIDLGFVFSPISSDLLRFEPIKRGQMYLCGGKMHPLAHLKFSEIRKRISEYPAIIHRPTDSVERCDNHPMFKKFGIKPQIRMYWDSDYFAAAVLKGNEYWSLLPDVVIEGRQALKKFDTPEGWRAPYKIGMVWNKNRAVDSLREALRDQLYVQ